MATCLLRAATQEQDLNCLKHDQDVQTNGCVLDVEEIVPEFFLRVLNRISILVPNLCPACDSRAHQVPQAVVWDLLREPLNEFWTLRPRTHECHITLQHAPQLRDFVEPRHTEKFAHSGNPGVVIIGPCRPEVRLCIGAHRAELVAEENLSLSTYSFLAIKSRPLGVELNGKDHKRNERSGQQQTDEANGKIQKTPQDQEKFTEVEALLENDPARVHILDIDLAGDLFQPRRSLFDVRCALQP